VAGWRLSEKRTGAVRPTACAATIGTTSPPIGGSDLLHVLADAIGRGIGAILHSLESPEAARCSPKRAESPVANRIADATTRGRIGAATQGPSVAERTDEQLLAATIDGDRQAFAVLVERYRHELLHFLIRFLGSRSAAEDVFQETFLQVYTAARTFDPERRLKPWLFTIAANKARDHFRRNRRQPHLSLSAPIGREGRGESFVDLLSDHQASPDAPMDEREQANRVRGVVDALAPHHREILLLSYFQRMSYQQMSECLEIPLGTVKSRLHAAVASFASAWRATTRHEEADGRGNQVEESN